jgi:Cdc6-like AAA superfamily ATPase
MPDTAPAPDAAQTFKVKVPASTGKTVTVTGHDGTVKTFDVKSGVVATDTADEAFRLACSIEGATLKTEEK